MNCNKKQLFPALAFSFLLFIVLSCKQEITAAAPAQEADFSSAITVKTVDYCPRGTGRRMNCKP